MHGDGGARSRLGATRIDEDSVRGAETNMLQSARCVCVYVCVCWSRRTGSRVGQSMCQFMSCTCMCALCLYEDIKNMSTFVLV